MTDPEDMIEREFEAQRQRRARAKVFQNRVRTWGLGLWVFASALSRAALQTDLLSSLVCGFCVYLFGASVLYFWPS